MFGRSKPTLTAQRDEPEHPVREGAKNRPTPKRRDQEAARKQPLVVTDRKVARVSDKAKRREAYAKQREAMVTGDDRYLPVRDKGPVRRFVRDSVDAHFRIGEVLLPAMVVVLALTFVAPRWPQAYSIIFFCVYGLVALAIVDAFLFYRRMKRTIDAKFPADQIPRGLAWYTVMRAFQMRRTRMPKPQVKRGDTVA